jgi:cation:H+ antiporter
LTRTDGALLVIAAIIYTAVIVDGARRENRAVRAEFTTEYAIPPVPDAGWQMASQSALLAIAIVVIVVGADWLVRGAIDLARMLGVSEAFIGLTVVAIGTSSPELVTTVVSTVRRARDIAIGNLVGSSIYNILFILGVTAMVPSAGIHVGRGLVHVDIPIIALVAIACVPVFLRGQCVTRVEGGLFVGAYLLYLAYLMIART